MKLQPALIADDPPLACVCQGWFWWRRSGPWQCWACTVPPDNWQSDLLVEILNTRLAPD